MGRVVERAVAERARVCDGAEAPGGGEPAGGRGDCQAAAERDLRAERIGGVHASRGGVAVAYREAAEQTDLPVAGSTLFEIAGRGRADVRAGQWADAGRVHVVHEVRAGGISSDGE